MRVLMPTLLDPCGSPSEALGFTFTTGGKAGGAFIAFPGFDPAPADPAPVSDPDLLSVLEIEDAVIALGFTGFAGAGFDAPEVLEIEDAAIEGGA